MGKNNENIPYDWADDDYLWSEYDGEDLPARELTLEEKEEIAKLFKTKMPNKN